MSEIIKLYCLTQGGSLYIDYTSIKVFTENPKHGTLTKKDNSGEVLQMREDEVVRKPKNVIKGVGIREGAGERISADRLICLTILSKQQQHHHQINTTVKFN